MRYARVMRRLGTDACIHATSCTRHAHCGIHACLALMHAFWFAIPHHQTSRFPPSCVLSPPPPPAPPVALQVLNLILLTAAEFADVRLRLKRSQPLLASAAATAGDQRAASAHPAVDAHVSHTLPAESAAAAPSDQPTPWATASGRKSLLLRGSGCIVQ